METFERLLCCTSELSPTPIKKVNSPRCLPVLTKRQMHRRKKKRVLQGAESYEQVRKHASGEEEIGQKRRKR